MKKLMILLSVLVMLSACADDGNSMSVNEPSDASSIIQESLTTVSKPSESESKAQAPIRAKIISYENEMLTCEYDGGEHSLPLPIKVLDDTPYDRGKTVAEKIIDNRFGITIYADLYMNLAGTIYRCDIYKPNGIEMCTNNSYFGDKTKDKKLNETEMTLKRTGGSKVELSNQFGNISADLNDMASLYKGDIPDYAERIGFSGVRFKDGELMLTMVRVYVRDEDSPGGPVPTYEAYTCKDKYLFFGTVQSLSEGRAKVLLTDGKTLCDVPIYYTDGELAAGMEVMLTLNAEPSLYGSGKKYKDDFAVFHTDPAEYNTSGSGFSELAYARYDQADIFDYIYTKADEARS